MVLTLWLRTQHAAQALGPGEDVEYRNPTPTVDVVILLHDAPQRVVLIRRRNPPEGWALPGGFIDEGEQVEDAARREALEETGLEVTLTDLLGVYSDPARDPRLHTISAVYCARTQAGAVAIAGDDAADVALVPIDQLRDEVLAASPPTYMGLPIAFDHAVILRDWLQLHTHGERPSLR